MTISRVAVLVLFALSVAVSAADVTGNWKLNINLNGVPELLCTVTQKTSPRRPAARRNV
jgi:hypothetical protein